MLWWELKVLFIWSPFLTKKMSEMLIWLIFITHCLLIWGATNCLYLGSKELSEFFNFDPSIYLFTTCQSHWLIAIKVWKVWIIMELLLEAKCHKIQCLLIDIGFCHQKWPLMGMVVRFVSILCFVHYKYMRVFVRSC